MTLEGSLVQTPLGDVLLSIGGKSSTGILTVQGENEIIAFSFLAGEIVSADALNQTLEDGLGEVLKTLGLVAAEDFAGLASEHQAGGGRVVDLLMERSYLSADQLLDAQRLHTYRLCVQALSWTAGDYKFYKGDEVSYEEGILPIPVEELLIRSSRELGAQAPLPGEIPESGGVYSRDVGQFPESPDAPALGGPDAAPTGDLGPEAVAVYELVDGSRTATDLAQQSGVSQFKVLFFVYSWLRAQAVQRVAQTAELSDVGELILEPGEAAGEGVEDVESLAAETAEPRKKAPRRGRSSDAARSSSGVLFPWPARLLGLGLAAAFCITLLFQASRLLLPFPWQGDLRGSLEEVQRATRLLKIQRAATSHFLLNGSFPEDLPDLVEMGLLSAADASHVGGGRLRLSSSPASYQVQVIGGGEPQAVMTRAITGNFLLDPEFILPDRGGRPPLVLLD